MASSLPEYKIYMDFKAGGHLKDSLLMLYMDSICDGLHQIFPDKSKAEFKSHILKVEKGKPQLPALSQTNILYTI